VVGGVPRWAERHARRLRRDALALRLGDVDPEWAERALVETARCAFGEGDGAVRLQASRDGDGRLHLLGLPRPLGAEPSTWRAVTSTDAHPGPMPWGGAKVTNHLLMGLARDEARARGADEAILFDRSGCAVEGTRSNLLFCGPDGVLRAVDPSRGAVLGVALETLREAIPEIGFADLARTDVLELRELVAVNALRGARAIVELDGRPVGSGQPGPAWSRIAPILDRP